MLNQTPSAFRQLLWAEAAVLARGGRQADRLRYVVFGGEALEIESLRPWFERHGDERPRLVNMYGITETTVHVTYRPLGRGRPRLRRRQRHRPADPGPFRAPARPRRQSGAAGGTGGDPRRRRRRGPRLSRPARADGREVRARSVERRDRASAGLIQAPRLGRGWLIQAPRQARGFIAPAISRGGGRMASWSTSGASTTRSRCAGSASSWERSRRRSPACPGSRKPWCWRSAGTPEDRRLVAFAVAARPAGGDASDLAGDGASDLVEGSASMLAEQGAPTLAQVRAALAASLPEYMLPSGLVLLPALPLTANGKVDRRALAALEVLPQEANAEAAPPETPLERHLAELFAAVLKLPAVGRDDDFFALGGHSISGAVLINRLQETLGEVVHVAAIFEHPTVRALAAHLERDYPEAVARLGRAAGFGYEVDLETPRAARPGIWAPIARGAWQPGEPLPLSFAQERLWFLDQLEPGKLDLQHTGRRAARGPARRRRPCAASLDEIVRRHATLRTTFAVADGRPAQVVGRRGGPAAAAGRPRRARPRTARGRGAAAGRRRGGAALRSRPRPGAARHAPAPGRAATHVLLFTLHHIAADGWSMGILVRELAALYAAFPQGQASPLPRAARPVRRLRRLAAAVAHRRGAGGAARLLARAARRRPAHARPPHRPAAPARAALPRRQPRRRPAARRGRGRARRRTRDRRHPVHDPARRLRGPAPAHHRPGGPRRRRHHRRPHTPRDRRADRLLRQHPRPARRARRRDRPARSHRAGARGRPRRLRPPGPALREAGRGAGSQARPVALAHLPGRLPAPERRPRDPRAARPHALPRRAGRTGRQVRPRAQLLRARRAASPRSGATTPISSTAPPCAAWPATSRSSSPPAPPTSTPASRTCPCSRRRSGTSSSSRASGGTGRGAGRRAREARLDAIASALLLHRRFEAQAAARPGETALACAGERLSYRELDLRANRLARHLRAAGVRPGVPVGLCLPRSLDMVVAILGVAKAGGAYLPLDPAYPAERLAFTLEDSRVPVLVTTRELLAALTPAPAGVRVDLPRRRGQEHRPAQRQGPARRRRPRGPRLRHLHVGLDRPAQGRRGHPRQRRPAVRRHRGLVRLRPRRRLDALPFLCLRLLGLGAVGSPRLRRRGWWSSRTRSAARPSASTSCSQHEGVTVLNQTPSAFRQLLWAEAAVLAPRRAAERTGCATSSSAARPWRSRACGPGSSATATSARASSTCTASPRPPCTSPTGRCGRADLDAGAGSVIGRPIPDLAVHLLDRDGNPVPLGVPGEIYVGGAGVARRLSRPARADRGARS